MLPRFSRLAARLVASVVASAAQKRALVAATHAPAQGAPFDVGGVRVRGGELLGAGLVGFVVSVPASGIEPPHAKSAAFGVPLVLKVPRAPLPAFRAMLAAEARCSDWLEASAAPFEVSPVVARSAAGLLKRRIDAPTVMQIVAAGGQRDPSLRSAVVDALAFARETLASLAVPLDVSAKNLAWNGRRLVLVDAGPKLTVSASWRQLVEDGSFEAFEVATRAKLSAGRSAPSVSRAAPPSAPAAGAADGGGGEATAAPLAPHVFVDALHRWIPLADEEAARGLCAIVDPDAEGGDALWHVDARGLVTAVEGAAPARLSARVLQGAAKRRFPRDTGHLAEGVEWPFEEPALDLGFVGDVALAGHLAHHLASTSLGNALAAWGPSAPLPAPRLHAEPHGHWRDLEDPRRGRATDVYGHEPVHEGPPLPPAFSERIDLFPEAGEVDAPFGVLELAPGAGALAVLMVAGFRADERAARALAGALRASGFAGPLGFVDVGARGSRGLRIVTSGRWESVALLRAFDALERGLGIRTIALVAASQGALGASIAAALDPRVTALVLDSPVARPTDVVRHLARVRGDDPDAAIAALAEAGLPSATSVFHVPARPGLATLVLEPRADPFAQIAGRPGGGEGTVTYEGRHAATMRHDVSALGLPDAALEAILAVLARTSG